MKIVVRTDEPRHRKIAAVKSSSDGLPDYRVAVVTGGSRGIGAETVERLAGLGYAVVVDYAHDQRAAESTVEAILAGRGSAVAVRADIADELDVERLFAETIQTFGAIDAVVHTVRGRLITKTVSGVSLDEFDALFGLYDERLSVNRQAAGLR